jgi:dihydrofolate reductase
MSRKIISYIAISLDGKIAKPDGSVEWLNTMPNPDQNDYGYGQFLESIDTTIMGNATYKEVLSFDMDFPYKTLDNYVFTRNEQLVHDDNVQFISSHFDQFIQNLREDEGADIWLIGGAQMNALFLKNGWLDELRVFVMPIVLGAGISLFSDDAPETLLTMKNTRTYETGVVEIVYEL